MEVRSTCQTKKAPKQRALSSEPVNQAKRKSEYLSLPGSAKDILTYIAQTIIAQNYPELKLSQSTLGEAAHDHVRETACRMTTLLDVERWITKTTSKLSAEKHDVCTYRLGPKFLSSLFLFKELGSILSLTMLLTCAVTNRPIQSQSVTRSLNKQELFKNINPGGDFDIPTWHCLDRSDISRNKKRLTSRTLSSPPRIRFEIRESTSDPLNRKSSSVSLGFVRGVPETNPLGEMARGSFYSPMSHFLSLLLKGKEMSMISSANREVGKAIGATEYGMLLLSAFPDSVLADAFASYTLQEKNVSNGVTWIWACARNLCKNRRITPLYEAMTKEVHAKGYGPKDMILIERDKEAQFRYDDPKPAVRDILSRPQATQPSKKAIDPNNVFAKMFPVPESIRANDFKDK